MEKKNNFKIETLDYLKLKYQSLVLSKEELKSFISTISVFITYWEDQSFFEEFNDVVKGVEELQDKRKVIETLKEKNGFYEFKGIKFNLTHLVRDFTIELIKFNPNNRIQDPISFTSFYRFDFGKDNPKYKDSNELIWRNQPYYPNFYELVLDKFGKELDHNNRDHNSLYLILHKDCRASVSITSIIDSTISFKVKLNESKQINLKLYAKNHTNETHSIDEIIKKSRNLSIKFPFRPSIVYGVVKDDDKYKSIIGNILYRVPEQSVSLDKEGIKNLILNGEGLNTEFKEEYPQKKGKLIDRKIIHDLCAFANQEGGRIIFGVDDESNIVGFKYPDKLQSFNSFEAHIQNICSTYLEPSINIQVNELKIDKKTVVIIGLVELPEFYVRVKNTKEYYIRKGSTSRKIKPGEIQKPKKEMNFPF